MREQAKVQERVLSAETDNSTDDPAPRHELNEIMAELRVMVQGNQVIFAFLLTIPFTERFSNISQMQQNVYFLAFVAAAGTISLMIAPSAIHRVQRHPTHEAMDRLLRTSTTLIINGSVLMAGTHVKQRLLP